mmetsp:Transcript_2303/g.3287  ORF Transcript_2303/g.3287 Transcript_2303/m.3287 type:complete len:92 (+) Transcript_2303:38-313(+)
MSGAMRSSVLRLYRQMLFEGSKYHDYNFRSYVLRRVRDQFHRRMKEDDPALIADYLKKGTESLNIIKRQRMLDNMYSNGANVMEKIAFHPR